MIKKTGQTIVEVLIALFVISVGLYGAMSLMISNDFLQSQNKKNLVMMNLAREALEIVQNKRDSNWLANANFAQGILDGPNCTAVTDWDGGSYPSFDFSVNDLENARLKINHSESTIIEHRNGTDISYYRLLTFSAICQNKNDVTDKVFSSDCSCPSNYKVVGVRSKVDVGYKDNGWKKITIYSDLYDWR